MSQFKRTAGVSGLSLGSFAADWWRLLVTPLWFSSAGEVLFGLALLYTFRLFERQMGTLRFAVAFALPGRGCGFPRSLTGARPRGSFL